jgi:hypothetical protein
MMKKIRLILMLGAVIALGMTSCKKGDTGPAGPVGPAGPDSVVYSQWQTLNFTFFETDSSLVDTIAAPSITQGILDSGVILTYYNLANPTDPSAGTDLYSGAAISNFGLIEDYKVGEINIESFIYDFSTQKMRYVTIPGSKLETVNSVKTYKGYTVAELKAMPYTKAAKIVGGPVN